jgi:hypothetical protein
MSATSEVRGRFPTRLRPDLPIPLAPDRGSSALMRAALTRLKTPAFAEARRSTLRTTAVLVAVVAVGPFALVSAVWPWTYAGAGLTLAVLTARAAVLRRAARRQQPFQELWLGTRSAALRRTPFEVIRFTVMPSPASGGATVWDTVGYDLTNPEDIRDLMDRRAAEDGSGLGSRVVLEFCHEAGAGAGLVVEEVWADLATLDLRASAVRLLHPGVTFPGASYHGRPMVDSRGRTWPARETFWTLGAPVVAAVRPSP